MNVLYNKRYKNFIIAIFIIIIIIIIIIMIMIMGSRDGAVVRALVSHQFFPGPIPGPADICGLSLLLVLALACSEFCFPRSTVTNTSKF